MYDKLALAVACLARGLGTPLATNFKELADLGWWAELVKLRCAPGNYNDSESFWKDAQLIDFMRKIPLDVGVDTEKVAHDTFYECEKQCCASNARLTRFLPQNGGFGLSTKEWRIFEFFEEWRQEISNVLGPLPPYLVPRFSNGATVSNKSVEAAIPDKMSGNPSFYSENTCVLPYFWETSWGVVCRQEQRAPMQVRGNHFFTVVKDSEKRRGCGLEASIPVTLQLAAGSHIRKRLKTVLGLDIRVLQDSHRDLARLGSLIGHRATIDQSNASDTVCKVLVQLGLNDQWYSLLDSLRAHFSKVRDRWVRLEKFSSMGNGFTFELETLLFVTLARVVVRLEGGDPDECSCYGDDLIVPTAYVRPVLAVLAFCGFTTNKKKTFSEGPFRESCGGDFFNGVSVSTFKLEEWPVEPQQWISAANGLRRSAAGIESRWDALRPLWRFCLAQIPSDIRELRGPVHLGDIVIHDEPEYWITSYRQHEPRADSPKYRCVKAWVPIAQRLSLERWGTGVQLAACHLTGKHVERRSSTIGFKARWVPCDLTSSWLPGVH